MKSAISVFLIACFLPVMIMAGEIVTLVDTIQLSNAGIWGNLAFNGKNISATTTSHQNTLSYLYLRKLDADMNQIGDLVQLTFDSDSETAKKITDHKMIFLNGHHYVTFSTMNMDLYVFKTDIEGQRMGNIVPVVENTVFPTNDMFLTTDSTMIYVGYFKPNSQTIFHGFDQDLNAIGDSIVTYEQLPHNNIGSVIYYDNKFQMFTGTHLGHGASLLHTRWHADWSPAIPKGRIILQSSGGDGNSFSTGLARDPVHNYWMIAFHHMNPEDTATQHIDLAVFDKDFILLERHHVTPKSKNRPGLVLWNEYLYMIYDGVNEGVFMKKFRIDEKLFSQVNWKSYFTLDPLEGIAFSFPENYMVTEGGVPVLGITPNEEIILSFSGGPGKSGSLAVSENGEAYDSVAVPSGRAPDGGIIYLPDGRLRFIGEENAPNSTQQKRRSRIVSSISYDGIQWGREEGIRYQPGAEDDSISSVPSVIQVEDSVWRMYYVGDFSRTNGIRTAISTDWGLTWQQESVNNILRNHDVDPHAVHLSDGRVRIYHRHMRDPGGIAYTDGDGLVFDTTNTMMLIPDETIADRRMLDPAVIKFPDGQIACYIGASPKFGGSPSQLVVAFANEVNGLEDSVLSESLPSVYQLYPNSPNPFNPSTEFMFTLPKQSHVTLTIYDMLGREAAVLVDGDYSPGVHRFTWDAGDFPSGVYFYMLSSESGVLTRKCLLLR